MSRVYEIEIRGLVQGVGFRPYVYRIAKSLNLHGFTDNRTSGVKIVIQATEHEKEEFLRRLYAEKPEVAQINGIQITQRETDEHLPPFYIARSKSGPKGITRVSPDIAVCRECLTDLREQPHRLNYPFINCTHCGPRFSIVETIPYDRVATTMRDFDMCPLCHSEYHQPDDRRFHAQPVACNHCGPAYAAVIDGQWTNDYARITAKAAACLKAGGILALKGTGGFNWIADATNDQAVRKLRELKKRYHKPFALLFGTMDDIKTWTEVSPAEQQELESWRRAIVVLNEKKKLSHEINGPLQTLGAMLPYLPIHYALFQASGIPALVITSANRPGEPMLTENEEARAYLLPVSDFYIEHNRRIHNRVDDSVVRIIQGSPQLLRRARGYTPEPLLNTDPVEGGLAFGAEMTAVFALGKANEILLSQYLGELRTHASSEAYKETLGRLAHLFRFQPSYLVADLHPEYVSTRHAFELAEQLHIPLYQVQHHHAHAVSVMAEHHIDHPCMALCLDGTGWGDDGQSWGGELLKCTRTGYDRVWHLPYVPLPGGDKASEEGWRMAVSYINTIYGAGTEHLPQDFTARIGQAKAESIVRLMHSPLTRFQTSSMGRLFDAVSSLIGVCDHNSFQAEAAMRLEHLASTSDTQAHYAGICQDTATLKPLFDGILHDLSQSISPAAIARKFHNTLVKLLTCELLRLSRREKLDQVVLSGGVFQNKLLSELLINRLEKNQLRVYYPKIVPANDGGIAVGQLASVAALRKTKNTILLTNQSCTNYQLQ